jgi:DNA-binding response OmpR family regulator
VKILVVEDEAPTSAFLQRGLGEEGFAVDVAADAASANEHVATNDYDAILLDVMLPGSDGFALCKQWRANGVTSPILFLTARDDVADRIAGLDRGGDDYLVKPFAFAELLARISAVARRTVSEPGDGKLAIADLELDLRRHAVTRGGKPIELTPKEFSLLEYLLRHQGQAISRAMITEKVWGYGFDTYSNLIDVHINHLRKKVDKGYAAKLIHTVKGVGYVLEERGAEA